MALILQFPDSGLTGVDRFALEAGSLSVFAWEQSWSPDQGAWSQLESDDAFPDDLQDHSATIDFSSISASPEAVRIRRNMRAHARSESMARAVPTLPRRMSILDFPPLDLGAVLRPLGPDDDILGEMLDETWS